ncbi:hypothetical protein BJY01DRAFT_254379, partial [Aspergillus pseudoustus]
QQQEQAQTRQSAGAGDKQKSKVKKTQTKAKAKAQKQKPATRSSPKRNAKQPQPKAAQRLAQRKAAQPKVAQPRKGKQTGKSGNNKNKRALAANATITASADTNPRPTKVLVTAKDRGIQHWIDNGTLPGIASIDPAYAPYCARLKRRNLVSTRSGSLQVERGDDENQVDPDANSREKRKKAYASAGCAELLAQNGAHMDYARHRPTDASRTLCRDLFEEEKKEVLTPEGTALDWDKAYDTLTHLQWRSETAIIRMMGELIVPSVETVADRRPRYGITLAFSMDEPWDLLIPLHDGVPLLERPEPAGENAEEPFTLPIPQPDYAAGFSRTAMPLPSSARHTRLYFPFLTADVRVDLDIAGSQNAHTMALCVRALVYLYRLVGREAELDRHILGISIAHNSTAVRIYGHYPVISKEDGSISYHHHDIAAFVLKREDRWQVYQFVMALYTDWTPLQLERILGSC